MNETETSKFDWEEFRALEAKRHNEFFLPKYKELGMKVVRDIYDDTKTNDYDVIVDWEGKRYSVDEKARQREYLDMLVEVMQCIRAGKIGWLYKRVDKLFYASWARKEDVEPTSAYWIDVPMLKDFVADNWEQLPDVFSSRGYGLTFNKRLYWQHLIDLGVAKKIV